jgi:putative membrane protein
MTSRRFALVAAALVVAIVLSPPMHRAADDTAVMHMVQHLVLILVVAPLFAFSGAAPLVGSLPRPLGRGIGRALAAVPGRRVIRDTVRAPIVAWVVHVAALWLWHLPGIYDVAVRSHALHALEHATFVGTAVLFWSPLVRPARRAHLGFGGGLVYTFTAAMQSSVLGALLAFAERPWYASHGAVLADQQLAGVLMWVPAGCVYLIVMLWWLASWLGESRRRAAAAALGLILAIAPGVGCRRSEPPPPPRVVDGDPKRGASAIARHGCGACHRIPGIDGARGVVGPSLADLARRTFLAGALPNDPGNLIRWIRDPQAIEPGTVMPRLGVTEGDAADIAAYLYRLR